MTRIAVLVVGALLCSSAWAQQTGHESTSVSYSPWTRFCGKDKNRPRAEEVCLTIKEARLATGQAMCLEARIPGGR